MKWLRSLFNRKTEIIPEDKPAKNQSIKPKQEWGYGVVGNITKTHIDENGIMRYGSTAFRGGTKVYLCGKYWTKDQDTIEAIGVNRHSRRISCSVVPAKLIENVRCAKVYNPAVLEIMRDHELGYLWWHTNESDGEDVKRFVEMWNEEEV